MVNLEVVPADELRVCEQVRFIILNPQYTVYLGDLHPFAGQQLYVTRHPFRRHSFFYDWGDGADRSSRGKSQPR